MKPLTLDTLQAIARETAPSRLTLSVGLDSSGIAAGGEAVLAALREENEMIGSPYLVRSTGSLGLAFADPVVQVRQPGGPTLLYGAVDPTVARRIVRAHFTQHGFLNDHLIATRERSTTLGDLPTSAILIQDTETSEGDKTEFFQESLQKEIALADLPRPVPVFRALDLGVYDRGLCVQLIPSGVTYTRVLASDLRRIVEKSLRHGRIVANLLHSEKDPQVRIVLRHCGLLDPDSLADALAHGVYQGLRKVLTRNDPQDAIRELQRSGLRGRGGAGFPTWRKWQLTRDPPADRKFVICNADEGDPGAFMDRSVLEGDPHSVLEGLIIAAFCIGASTGFFYIRAEYPLAVERIQRAIEEARAAGLLGDRILGTEFCFDAQIRLGAGAFVCGEETALIASIEGKRGSPIPRPPYPSVSGLWGKPTSINNVETLAAVPAIYDRGADWYAAHGTPESAGTKVFAVTGKVKYSQLVEVPMGIPIRRIIYEVCGGVLDDAAIKGVQTGGPSGGVIPDAHLDTPVTYENLQALGSIMGSGGMLVMDEHDSMVDVAKFYLKFCVDESCGKCAPCRVGGYQMLQLLEKIARGRGEADDLTQLRRICHTMQHASLCGLGQTAPNPVLSTLRFFPWEYDAFIEGGASYARTMKKKLAAVGAAQN